VFCVFYFIPIVKKEDEKANNLLRQRTDQFLCEGKSVKKIGTKKKEMRKNGVKKLLRLLLPLLLHRIHLPLRRWHLGIVGIQRPNRSCWIRLQ